MSDVPHELITKILPLLAVKTLLRFRCISKSLCYIIDNPDFIDEHLLHARTNPKIIFREHFPFHHINPVPIHIFNINGPFPPLRDLDGPFHHELSSAFFAHCNGLVLLMERPFSFVVWNPSTRKCWNLPVLPAKVSGEWETNIVAWGFGYDSSINDYKVLIIKQTRMITWYASDDYDIEDEEYEIMILSFRSGYWRLTQYVSCFKFNFLGNTYNFRDCFVDGAFHFCDDYSGVISAFDVAKETISEVSLPDFILAKRSESPPDYISGKPLSFLQVIEGCLCVSILSPTNNLDLYARKKNDVGEFFWTKLLSTNYPRFPFKQSSSEFRNLWSGEILGFSKEEDKMYVLCCKYAVYSYDFNEKTIKMIGAIDGDNKMAFSCVESLVRAEVPSCIESSVQAERLVRAEVLSYIESLVQAEVLSCIESSVQAEVPSCIESSVRVKKNQRNKKKPILHITSLYRY